MATNLNISIASSIVDNAHKAYDSGFANVLTNDAHGRHFWIQTTNAAWRLYLKFLTPIRNPKHGPLTASVAEAYHDLRDQVGPNDWAPPGVATTSTFWVPDANSLYGYHEITDESQIDGVTPTEDCDWAPDADRVSGYHEITDESQIDGVTPTEDYDDEVRHRIESALKEAGVDFDPLLEKANVYRCEKAAEMAIRSIEGFIPVNRYASMKMCNKRELGAIGKYRMLLYPRSELSTFVDHEEA